MSKKYLNTPHHFYIFRHGIATLSTTGYGDQIYSAPLLPEAILVIKNLAAYLKPIPSRLHFSSEILRCRQTTEIVTEVTGKSFLFDARLNEYHQETFENFTQRVVDFLEFVTELADDMATHNSTANEENILICTHGAVIACLKNILVKDTFSSKDELDYPMPGELIEFHQGSTRVLSFV